MKDNFLLESRLYERQFFIAFFFYNFSRVFSKFQKNKLYESRLYKKQLLRVFLNFKKIYMKIVFRRDDFHIIIF